MAEPIGAGKWRIGPTDKHILKVEISSHADDLLYQMKVILGKSKSEVVQEALELYFRSIQSENSGRTLAILLFLFLYSCS